MLAGLCLAAVVATAHAWVPDVWASLTGSDHPGPETPTTIEQPASGADHLVPAAGTVSRSDSTSTIPDVGTDDPEILDIVVVGELEHDPTAFTQGLEMHDGGLYESTGAPGDRASSIRELDRDTGRVLRRKQITEDVFAEGLTFYNDQIYQLTWQDGVAFVRDPDDLSETWRFTYTGEGWGVCYNGSALVMSDGTAELHFRDPATFQRIGNPVTVTMRGKELSEINELECVGTSVYANVWQTDIIVKIDLVTGHVTAVADASGIGLPRPNDPDAVLNGIAWDPATQTFLITGKDWPAIYEVRFEPDSG